MLPFLSFPRVAGGCCIVRSLVYLFEHLLDAHRPDIRGRFFFCQGTALFVAHTFARCHNGHLSFHFFRMCPVRNDHEIYGFLRFLWFLWFFLLNNRVFQIKLKNQNWFDLRINGKLRRISKFNDCLWPTFDMFICVIKEHS